jgi:outer membrane protein assembly factor BamB
VTSVILSASLPVASLAAPNLLPVIVLDPGSGPPARLVGIKGSGFGSSEQIRISFAGKLVATAQANTKGSFSASFEVPKGAKPGEHTVNAKGDQANRGKATFTVQVDWVQFRYDPAHSGTNPYEHVLSPKNVHKLKVKWKHRLAYDSRSSPAVVDGVVYVGDDSNDLYALDAKTGKQIWRYTTSDTGFMAPAVANGVVYVNFASGVDAVNATTGKRIWHYQVFQPRGITIVDGLVYFGSYQGGVYAVDAATGAKRWFRITGAVETSPAVADGVLYVGTDDDRLYAIDSATGAIDWIFKAGDYVRSSPSVADGVVCVGADDGHVYALDADTGAQLWAFALTGYVESALAVSGGVVYASAYKAIYAIRASDGTKLWVRKQPVPVASSPAIANGVVYVGGDVDNTGALQALNATTGKLLWRKLLSGFESVKSSPAVVDGVVYCGSPDGYAFAFAL